VNQSTFYPDLKTCLERNFALYYFSEAVATTFQQLYDNTFNFQTALIRFWESVAHTFAKQDFVLGYELINEPPGGNFFENPLLLTREADKINLQPMYDNIAAAIRKIDNNHNIFFEKSVTNAVETAGFTHGPGGDSFRDKNVYSYHDYCLPTGKTTNVPLCDATNSYFYTLDLESVRRLGGGGFMTEFGAAANTTSLMEALSWQLTLADKEFQSWTYWQYKSYDDITTSGGYDESFYDAHGNLQLNKAQTLSRSFAPAIAGTPKSMSFDRKTKLFTLTYAFNPLTTGPTEIYINEAYHYSKGFVVSIMPPNVASWKRVEKNRIAVFHKAKFTELTIVIKAK